MAVLAFPWKDGEGYDIHVLRGPLKSKPLLTALKVDTTPNALKPVFTPNFTGASSVLGVSVDSTTGKVTATAQPAGQPNKFPNFNFLIKAHQAIGGVATYETEIRVHIHNSIKSIWLTPSSLTPHVGSNECRFTVLARFDDDTVGDITDWPQSQLTFKSAPATAVAMLPGGILQAKLAGKTATITVTLKLNSPPTNKTATAQVFTKPSWRDLGNAAKLEFVAGPFRPNESDFDSDKPDSLKSVEAHTNILFISEGFLSGQEQDFRHNIVDVIVNDQLRIKEYLQPFKLLANSINYWAVFLESQEEGISVFGDQAVNPTTSIAFPVPLPSAPASSASQWSLANLIHEGGLPLPNDPPVPDPGAWVTNRSAIFAPSLSAAVIAQADVDAWNDLRPRFLLNERNSAFGLAHYDRPRVSDQGFSPKRLQLDPRRMSESSLQDFVGTLPFAKNPTTGQFWGIGRTWLPTAKDTGLFCFICRSDTRGGRFKPSSSSMAYFTVSTGDKDHVDVKAAGDGQDIVPPNSMAFSAPLVASLVAYGFGGAHGLNDEEGDGAGGAPSSPTGVSGSNLQEEGDIVSTPGGVRSIDAQKIAWLWPRITKAEMVDVQADASGKVTSPQNCDQNGTPNPTGAFFLVTLRRAPPIPFAKSDLVRLRGSVVRISGDPFWRSPSQDEIAGFPLKVDSISGNTLVLSREAPNMPQLGYFGPTPGTQLAPDMFKSVEQCYVIAPLIVAGNENKLLAKPIFDHIGASASPLNAPVGSQGQSCTPAPQATADVTAANLPAGLKFRTKPASKWDIIGIYDGGGHFDCGIFRPAGRCRMRRAANATTPFCQICRYVIVDRVDPTVHGLLDHQYDLHYPK